MENEDIRQKVREGYGKIAEGKGSCCNPVKTSCCGGTKPGSISRNVGYSEAEMAAVPDGADLGLGCGNPTALASIKEGETVLDLGSGAGFDCFLAARKAGKTGKVIGVDMTSAMVDKARWNAAKGGYENVEFRLGEIENLPVADNSVDLIISNCVINLSPHKERVFQEAFRVLKPGGRVMISDLVLLGDLPSRVRKSVEAYIGCLAGAIRKEEYLGAMTRAGFSDVVVQKETGFPVENMANDATAQTITANSDVTVADMEDVAKAVVSIQVAARKRG